MKVKLGNAHIRYIYIYVNIFLSLSLAVTPLLQGGGSS